MTSSILRKSLAIAVVLGAGLVGSHAQATEPYAASGAYKYIDLVPGTTQSGAYAGINEAGQVGGSYGVDQQGRAAVWNVRTGSKAATGTGGYVADDINNIGATAGTVRRVLDDPDWDGARNSSAAYFWKPGSAPVVQRDFVYSNVLDLSNSNRVLLEVATDPAPFSTGSLAHLYIWNPVSGTKTNLGQLDEYDLIGGINDRNQVVGTNTMAFIENENAILWDGRTGRRIEFPGAASAINNSGTIAGQLGERATVWGPDLKPRTVPAPGIWSKATGINDAGHIVGEWYATEGQVRSFFWNPSSAKAIDLGPVLVDDFNGKGQVVVTDASSRPVVLSPQTGGKTPLPMPTSANWKANGLSINDRGEVSGTIYRETRGGGQVFKAFAWKR